MTPEDAKRIVLEVYPLAECKSSDFDVYWIGLPPISEFFEWDQAKADVLMGLPFDTDEEVETYSKARRELEEEATNKAWMSAASRIEQSDDTFGVAILELRHLFEHYAKDVDSFDRIEWEFRIAQLKALWDYRPENGQKGTK